jgi:hypothetical protein
MPSYFLISILCVVNVLHGCLFANAFCSSPTKELTGLSSSIRARRKNRSYRILLFAEENSDEEEKDKKLDSLADPADVEDLPMFSLDYNSDNVDYSQLAVPPFTSAIVFFVSTAFTVYLYYVGITGGVATAPPGS